ncbi:MAG: ABC transporter permease [Opitutaceae bacterium]
MIQGFLYHLQLTLRLNFKSRQPLIYGYLVPVLFLVAFGAVFRSGRPPLLHEMGQLITISALGGACFGLPTALVSERERGLWRRFRLLPNALWPLVTSTLLARFVLIASAAALQIALARLIYGTPAPQHPASFIVGYAAVAFAFLGMGLLVAALAEDVPAVQALGQCIFLPLIMIGGVGIPLLALPLWTQRIASFLPGRYAVDALQRGYSGEGTGVLFRFNLLALLAMGLAAGFAGGKLFRWDQAHRPERRPGVWILGAIVPWLVVGAISLRTERWHALVPPVATSAASITEAQIASIGFDGLPPDDGVFTPLASVDFEQDLRPDAKARIDAIAAKLRAWPPGRAADSFQAIRSLLSVASIADVAEDPLEGPIARTVLDLLYHRYRMDVLERGLAWIALYPEEGGVRTSVPELDIPGDIGSREVRARSAIYAAKFLGRVRGRIPM